MNTQISELPSPYGDCNATDDYVQSVCLTDCFANYVIDHCNCKDTHLPGDRPLL